MTVGQHVEGGLDGWDEAFVCFFSVVVVSNIFVSFFTPNPRVSCTKLTVLRIFLPMGGSTRLSYGAPVQLQGKRAADLLLLPVPVAQRCQRKGRSDNQKTRW